MDIELVEQSKPCLISCFAPAPAHLNLFLGTVTFCFAEFAPKHVCKIQSPTARSGLIAQAAVRIVAWSVVPDGFLRRLAPPPVAAGRGIGVALAIEDL